MLFIIMIYLIVGLATSKKCSSAVSDGAYWDACLAARLRKNSSARAVAEKVNSMIRGTMKISITN
jgi:hypothetical protein